MNLLESCYCVHPVVDLSVTRRSLETVRSRPPTIAGFVLSPTNIPSSLHLSSKRALHDRVGPDGSLTSPDQRRHEVDPLHLVSLTSGPRDVRAQNH